MTIEHEKSNTLGKRYHAQILEMRIRVTPLWVCLLISKSDTESMTFEALAAEILPGYEAYPDGWSRPMCEVTQLQADGFIQRRHQRSSFASGESTDPVTYELTYASRQLVKTKAASVVARSILDDSDALE